ncbi:uncharacterized [Tachysurus ichikawai]
MRVKLDVNQLGIPFIAGPHVFPVCKGLSVFICVFIFALREYAAQVLASRSICFRTGFEQRTYLRDKGEVRASPGEGVDGKTHGCLRLGGM